jgi:site-specific recombinase XerD
MEGLGELRGVHQVYRGERFGLFYTIRRLVQEILHRPGAHPHMLRHSFASRLRENGADLQDIQEALGHAVITTRTMYSHLTTRRQREKLTEFLK